MDAGVTEKNSGSNAVPPLITSLSQAGFQSRKPHTQTASLETVPDPITSAADNQHHRNQLTN